MVELTVVSVPGCPNVPVLLERLGLALAGRADVRVVHRVVRDEGDAVRFGMHGSPTLLVDGVDPFAAPGTPFSVSCRIYRDEAGQAGGAPSVAALRTALDGAGGSPPVVVPDAVGRAGRGRIAPVAGGLRVVHQCVVRAFAEIGRPPSADELDDAAAPFETDGRAVLDRLHVEDFLRLDANGAVRAAYPFSAVPTPHLVEIENGPRVFAMCAIDALGIAAMLGKPVTIRSTEPGTGTRITVTVPASSGPATWEPDTAVVFVGRQTTCEPTQADPSAAPIAAETCCGSINFFTSRAGAASWAQAHLGMILDQRQALDIGAQTFGRLLEPTPMSR